MSAELLGRARAGDRDAFAALVEPHRGELQVHCYRMLGSLQDAEDALQETLLSAWLGLDGFELPYVFRTGKLRLIHAASCPFRYSSKTSCGVR
jgi:DNA-directed RNA polymerase specialized sigma24 family protein